MRNTPVGNYFRASKANEPVRVSVCDEGVAWLSVIPVKIEVPGRATRATSYPRPAVLPRGGITKRVASPRGEYTGSVARQCESVRRFSETMCRRPGEILTGY